MQRVIHSAVFAVCVLLLPASAFAWGANGARMVTNRAIDTLPPDLRPFFDANRDFILRHVTDPFAALERTPKTELPNHTLFLDHYGKFPFDPLPRNYKSAVSKFGRAKLEASGV